MSERNKLFGSEKDHLACKYLCFCIDKRTAPSFEGFVNWCEDNGFLNTEKIRETFMGDIFGAEVQANRN